MASADDEMLTDGPSPKRTRTDLTLYSPPDDDAAYHHEDPSQPIRTSSLDQPTMKLSGHKGSVYALAYNSAGDVLCSGSFDTTCLLWSGTGDCHNFNVLSGHKNAVLDVKFSGADSGGERIVTASADKNLAWWDATTGTRVKRFMGHTGIVNAVDAARSGPAPLVVSGSDDRTARLWDARVRGEVGTLEDDYPVTAVSFSADGKVVYTAGIDNCITAWDVRRSERTMKMKGHSDTVTCLSLHPDGTHLLSNSMDGTLRTWDVRPYVSGPNRHDKTFVGGTHNAEKGLLNCAWSADGTMVTGGSADRVVHIWDVPSSEELYALPGHAGCVNAVIFSPRENVVASGSSDKSIFVGELAQ